jgi:hypothetical protein
MHDSWKRRVPLLPPMLWLGALVIYVQLHPDASISLISVALSGFIAVLLSYAIRHYMRKQ